jgi:hypothetical protein
MSLVLKSIAEYFGRKLSVWEAKAAAAHVPTPELRTL